MNSKEELIQTYQWLRQYGLNDSHSGNCSLREDNHFWVTPTGACADTLSTDKLIHCELQKKTTEGSSLDAGLHNAVYLANPSAHAVLHSHNPYTIALTLDGNDFTPVDFEGFYYFGTVPVIDIRFDRYVEEAPGRVSSLLTKHSIVVVRGHGVYSCAESINLAYKWVCSLELSAKTAYLARTVGTVK
ncbi:MAG: class II aldolase/adducin family protein [Gammaproteobacteria bacterium]|nr:MAG: class II aldolase/adducin family protein [Gammaproteobacteria bacterium]